MQRGAIGDMRRIQLGSSRLAGAFWSVSSTFRRLIPALGIALVALVLGLANAPAASADAGLACMQTGFEVVATDDASYPPGSVVHVSGAGYATSCDVVVRITRPDGVVETAVATTDLGGRFAYDYQLLPPPGAVGEYTVDVLGLGDALLASTTFVDALSATASVDTHLS